MNRHPLYSVAQTRQLERAASERFGVPGGELMQRAGRAAFALLRARWPQAHRIVVLCGPGNNGGDGYVLASLAQRAGLEVSVLALASPPGDSDAAAARADWLASGHGIGDIECAWPPAEVCVDALFGIGLRRALDGAALASVHKLNASEQPVLALDVPSGLDADSAAIHGAAVRASATITFLGDKRGLHTGAGTDCAGEVVVDALDLPAALFADINDAVELQTAAGVTALLPRRPNDSNKGRFGHVLAIGGDASMGGSIRLTGEAALRVGAGLVSIATREEHISAINAARPELMAHAVSGAQDLERLLERASVVAVGPGLGQRAWGHALWHDAIASGKPLVLDADGLNLLARGAVALPAQTVLTPHPGEAARLLGVSVADLSRDRFAAAQSIARQHHAVVVLKGAGSLIADGQGHVAVCPWGNPGMSSGGTGDVLTGVIAGLLAQGLEAWQAACAGVALHACAGDVAARDGEIGLIAGDLLLPLRRLRNEGWL